MSIPDTKHVMILYTDDSELRLQLPSGNTLFLNY